AAHVRMCVDIGNPAVGRPARVSDAQRPGNGLLFEQPGELRNSADPLADDDAAVVEDGQSRAVVAAVFEPVQALHQHIDGVSLPLPDIADDSTHGFTPESLMHPPRRKTNPENDQSRTHKNSSEYTPTQ